MTAMASDHGAGNLGFTGTASKAAGAGPAGLAAAHRAAFGQGPTLPMMPGSWDRPAD